MDLILSAAFSSITLTLYLFKKKDLNELKNTKPFPVVKSKDLENTEASFDKNITYYLEGLVSPIKDTEFLTCTHSKKKAVILKNIVKRHSVKWSNFWKDWIPEVEIISINGESVPFNVVKNRQPQITIPKLSIQDIMLVDLPVLSDQYINQNKKSIVKSIMDYVNGERFSGIQNMEKGFAIGEPITVIGKFKPPETIASTTTDVASSSVNTVKPSLEPDDLIVQSTHLPIFMPNLNDEEAYCILSSKTFKEIIEEEGKEVNKWKWVFIGSTAIIGGVVAFRIWRSYRRKRRAEELAEAQAHPLNEMERLQAAAYVEPPRNPSFFDMLRDIVNWLLYEDIEIDFNIDSIAHPFEPPSQPHYTPITEYIPDPVVDEPLIPSTASESRINNTNNNNNINTNTNTINNNTINNTNNNTNTNTNTNINTNININTNTNSNVNTTNTNLNQPSSATSEMPFNDTSSTSASVSASASASSTTQPNKMVPASSSSSSDESLCVVCLTEKREYAFLPCRHLCVCHHCLHYLEKCPLCRTPIQKYMKIFS
ncbi:hypothetical protein H8356DRAFT_1634163 [Neocallimastix lanati (nom. inval.)]|jgi:hypothetical protein|nr:hypothetical protein H8356DRAFT_1634163 [Neocallimastix sp. JGI-2020a]